MLLLNGEWGFFAAREDAMRLKSLIGSPSSSRQGEGGDEELTPTQHASGSFDAVCPLGFLFYVF